MDKLDYWFNSFTQSAVRLETFANYAIYDTNEINEYQKYTAGEKIEGFANADWITDIQKWNQEGKRIERIRVVPAIITDYFKYEFFWCYPKNIDAGEDIRFIDFETYTLVKEASDSMDFWMFDNRAVVYLDYNEDGEYVGCREETNTPIIDTYINFYANLRQRSMSYNDISNKM